MELESELGFSKELESVLEFEYPTVLVSELESAPKFCDSLAPFICHVGRGKEATFHVHCLNRTESIMTGGLLN